MWGAGVTASGLTHVAPGSNYPSRMHPDHRFFDWKRGRVLDALQIVLISGGGGRLETLHTGAADIRTGMAFLLLPGFWHRYRPKPETGWVESWIEVQGPAVAALMKTGTLSPTRVICRCALETDLAEILEGVHRRSRAWTGGFDAQSATTALQALAIFVGATEVQPKSSRIQRAVRDAERYLVKHHAEAINVEALARRVGVAYSYFRRSFRRQTGYAPWQYLVHLRLVCARRLLASSECKLDDVADRVGFSSGFHLSAAFKKAYGIPPSEWRRSLSVGSR